MEKKREVWRLELEFSAPWGGVKGVSVNTEMSKDCKEGKRESNKNGRAGRGDDIGDESAEVQCPKRRFA